MNDIKMWMVQCEMAREIEDEFGTQEALAYLIADKFINFLEAADDDPEWRREIPAFVERIKTIFEDWQLAEYLETVRETEPFDPNDYDDPEEAEQAHRHSEYGVPDERADEPEGDRRHDDERLHVGVQRDRQQGEDHEHRESEAGPEGREGVVLLPALPAEAERHLGVARPEPGQPTASELTVDLVGRDDGLVGVRRDGDDALPVAT